MRIPNVHWIAEQQEHKKHMFLCRHEGRREHGEGARLPQGMLRKQGTAGEPTNVIVVCVRRWEEHPDDDVKQHEVMAKVNGTLQPFQRNDDFSEQMFQATQNQNDIGWDKFLKERMSKHWSQAQETFFRHNNKEEKHNGKAWGKTACPSTLDVL